MFNKKKDDHIKVPVQVFTDFMEEMEMLKEKVKYLEDYKVETTKSFESIILSVNSLYQNINVCLQVLEKEGLIIFDKPIIH